MADPDNEPDSDTAENVLGADLTSVEDHLERRFPDAEAGEIQEAIEDAAEDLADARITTFRSLLVEHNASDALRREPDEDHGVPAPPDPARPQ